MGYEDDVENGFHDQVHKVMCPSPRHYAPKNGVEHQPIEILRYIYDYSHFKSFCVGNVIKYILRFEEKGQEGDLDKAEHYIEYIRQAYRDHDPTDADIKEVD